MVAAASSPATPARPASASVAASSALQPGDRVTVTVSYYYCEQVAGGYVGDGGGFCGRMRDGNPVYPGAAACDYANFGQRFRIEGDPTGRIYTCADTGGSVHGGHRDIWFLNNRDGADWQRVVGEGLADTTFAWAGPTEPGRGHYYAVRGPRLLIEYDNTQNGANHVHSVWRDLANDWGGDTLAAHYRSSHPPARDWRSRGG